MCNTPKYAKLEERTGNMQFFAGFGVVAYWLSLVNAHFAFQVMAEVLMKGKMWNTSKGRNLTVNMMKWVVPSHVILAQRNVCAFAVCWVDWWFCLRCHSLGGKRKSFVERSTAPPPLKKVKRKKKQKMTRRRRKMTRTMRMVTFPNTNWM